jgi:HK97 family phage portal protein
MTLRRLRETRAGSIGSYPNGWGWNDPAAIPPPGMFSMQRAGVPVTAKTSLQVDSVFTALRVISNAIIRMGNPRAFQWAYDDQNRPYKQWLPKQPNILTSTWGQMWQFDGTARSVISLALFGEAFWYTLTTDYLGFPSAIEVLHPAFVEIKVEYGVVLYFYGSGAQKVPLDPTRLTHIPFMAMPGAERGLNSIEYAGVAYALALAAMEYGQRWFSQGASPSFLLSSEQKLGQDQIERIAEKFLVEHSGLQSSHLPLVVDSGLKVEKISSTPDEAQFLGTLEYARMCIAAWFGLPSHLVGGAADKGNVWGKRCALDTLIPTPAGWTTFGDVAVGDEVFGEDGKVAKVTFLSPIDLAPESYRVRFNDGSHIDADADHLWQTTTYDGHTAVRTTREILDTLFRNSVRQDRNHRVIVAEPLDLPEAVLPVDPYILGYWLGDGTSASGRFTVGTQDLAALLEQIKIAGYFHSEPAEPNGDGVFQLTVSTSRVARGSQDTLVAKLRALGVLGDKHIPDVYLRASKDQRLALLQGLMDSDGSAISTRPRAEFNNANERLALGVLELAATLGLRPSHGTYIHKASGMCPRPSVQHVIGFDPKRLEVFRLARKQFAVGSSSKASRAKYRTITDVEPIDPVPMRCIQVDNKSHLFLVGPMMIPTHNTVQEQSFQLADFTLSGYVVRLEEAYSSLLPRGTFAALDESMLLRANAADLAAEITALRTTNVGTQNDIRVTKLNWPPVPGGDDINAPLASNVAPNAAANAVQAADKEDDVGSNSSGE